MFNYIITILQILSTFKNNPIIREKQFLPLEKIPNLFPTFHEPRTTISYRNQTNTNIFRPRIYQNTVIAQKNEQRRINYKAGIKKKREDYHTRGISLVSIHTVPLPSPVLYFRRIILLVRNRAALVIMNDCKYTSFQVTWSTMPRFHRVPPPLVLPSFFSLHPYARFFRRGNPREEGMVSYSFDFVRVVSRICFAGYSSEFSPVSARFLFHRYDTIFLPTGNRPPLFLPSIRAYERATRSRLFPRNSVSRSVRFVRWWETEREGGEVQVVHALRRAFPGSFCIVAHTGERNE